jgi:mannose/fructose/N-acetylgalactosamine-specific phosphotransferase system component IID
VAVKPMPAFARVFARLFTIQASWGYERMQGVGFGNAAEPALRSLDDGATGPRYRAALARQARFFNSHPYFAGLAVGAAVRAELDGETPERIERLRSTLGPPLGSLGDRLIWASWLPFCAALGIALFILGARAWSVVVFLALYNAVHLVCRWWALRAGWQHGMTVVAALQSPVLHLAGRLAVPVAGLSVGAIIPFAFGWQMAGSTPGLLAAAAAGAALFLLAARLAATRISGSALAAIVLGATWIAGLLWS